MPEYVSVLTRRGRGDEAPAGVPVQVVAVLAAFLADLEGSSFPHGTRSTATGEGLAVKNLPKRESTAKLAKIS